MNLNQALTALDKLGIDRFSFDGSAFSTKVTCNLYLPKSSEPVISETGRYGLDAMRKAVKALRDKR